MDPTKPKRSVEDQLDKPSKKAKAYSEKTEEYFDLAKRANKKYYIAIKNLKRKETADNSGKQKMLERTISGIGLDDDRSSYLTNWNLEEMVEDAKKAAAEAAFNLFEQLFKDNNLANMDTESYNVVKNAFDVHNNAMKNLEEKKVEKYAKKASEIQLVTEPLLKRCNACVLNDHDFSSEEEKAVKEAEEDAKKAKEAANKAALQYFLEVIEA
jgi:hypothetical protein